MKRKRYDVRGMMEWHPEFRVGRMRVQVSFTGGHLCGGASTAATFETTDPVVQRVIEESTAFKSGKITLGCVIEERGQGDRQHEEPRADSACGAAERRASAFGEPMTVIPEQREMTVMEFKDLDDAIDFLQDEKGCTVERVNSVESCVEEGKRMGILIKIKSGERP